MNSRAGGAVAEQAQPRTRWAWAVATCLGCGRLRPGPGTWTSAATVGLWWLLMTTAAPGWALILSLTVTVLLVAAGIPAASIVAREGERQDPSFVVIDEAAGQWLALIAAPLAWKTLVAGFILFRGFDILKPPPLRRLEKLPGGAGIMLDDVAAGLYTLVALQVLSRLGLLS